MSYSDYRWSLTACLALALLGQSRDATNAMKPVSIDTAEHYQWGSGCDGWYLAKTAGLHVIEERLPPGAGETLHFHRAAQQFFYVLEGSATFVLDGHPVAAVAGQGLSIAPGVRHRVRNTGHGALRLLVISQPPSHGDRVDVDHN